MQIPFYHFCTVCCTRDLILLLDRREGSILFFFGWWFHGAGFSGCPKERCVARAGPPAALSAPSHSHTWGTAWRGPPEAMQSAVNSQGSCFLSCCHSLFLSGEQWGTAPAPFSLPPSGMRITEEHSSDGGVSFLPSSFCCCFLTRIKSIHRVSHCLRFLNAGHCTELSSSYTCWPHTPGPAAAFVSGTLSFAWSHASTVQ